MFLTATEPAGFHELKELLLELAQERSLDTLLPLIVRRLIEESSVALARLWLLQPGDVCARCVHRQRCLDQTACLHLVASAMRPLHGPEVVEVSPLSPSRRIPVGAFKVGLVAARAEPVVVTDPRRDPQIRHPHWVIAEGIAGFVGQPLLCRGQLVGVLGVFSRVAITAVTVDVLRILANHAAAAIATARAFAQIEQMQERLQLENHYLRQAVGDGSPEAIVGNSAAVERVRQEISVVAPTDATALIVGESGTGKELVARSIHRQSRRAARPFVGVNCAAIPRDLFESEFFGHVRGAFSGAVRDRVGRFEAAEGGTLFLDEIGEMPLEVQGKLLRVLQEASYERVGDPRSRRADVRIIAATNRELIFEIEAGRFRQDLYYRLNVFPIAVPPLRERIEDLPLLASHFVAELCRKMHRPLFALSQSDLAELERYTWPGNIRELQNVLERAVISAGNDAPRVVLPLVGQRSGEGAPKSGRPALPILPSSDDGADGQTVSRSGADFVSPGSTSPRREEPYRVVPADELRRRERENILAALERSGGRIYGAGGAAEILGLKPTTLASRLERMGIRRPRGRGRTGD